MRFNWEEKINEYLNKTKSKVSLYMNEDETIKNISEISKEFDISFEDAEEIYIHEMEDYNLISEAGTAGNVAGLFLAPRLWFSWRTLNGIFSKASRKCGVYTISNKRDVCLHEVKIKILEKKMGIINKAAAECEKKAEDDNDKKAKCKEKEKNAIEKIKEQIDSHNEKIREIKKNRKIED